VANSDLASVAVPPTGPVVIDPTVVVPPLIGPPVAQPPTTGVFVGQLTDTKVPGSYNVVVKVAGVSTTCGTRFVRNDLRSARILSGDRT
jgi:hypothetical protein